MKMYNFDVLCMKYVRINTQKVITLTVFNMSTSSQLALQIGQ